MVIDMTDDPKIRARQTRERAEAALGRLWNIEAEHAETVARNGLNGVYGDEPEPRRGPVYKRFDNKRVPQPAAQQATMNAEDSKRWNAWFKTEFQGHLKGYIDVITEEIVRPLGEAQRRIDQLEAEVFLRYDCATSREQNFG